MVIDLEKCESKYGIIYADPPWSYRDKASSGKRGACYKYPLMTTEDICNLPVANIADEDCALFLWATMPKLQDAFLVMERWGFSYKTCAFVWVKQNKNDNGLFMKRNKLFMGMGNYTRANAEICLLGIKGNIKRVDSSVHSVVISPVERHSKKPDEVRKRIVRLVGDIPRIELFAREEKDGWDCWGNEV